MPNPACVAYETYRRYINQNTERDTYLLPWAMLSEHERKAWWEVIKAVFDINEGNTHLGP